MPSSSSRAWPTATWGRDELRAGELWTSNAVAAWLLVSAGLDVSGLLPPAGGRAPGWDAVVAVARYPALMSTACTFAGSTVTTTRDSPGRSISRRSAPYFRPSRSANE